MKYFICFTLLLCGACSSGNPYLFVDSTTTPLNTPCPPVRHTHKPANNVTSHPRYIVRRGDTLTSVSKKSGLSIKNIVYYNKLRSQTLTIGQTLILPGVYKLRRLPTKKAPVPTTPTKFKIYPRSSWAKQGIKGNITAMAGVNKITVHHTDDGPKLNSMSDVQFIRGIENHHRNNRKWACIGYHYIIGRDGKIYEARPVKYQGAHASKSNPHNVGISLIGDFNKHMPANSQLTSLNKLLSYLRTKYKVTARKVYGHTHLGQTECPGKYLKSWIERYRNGR